MTRNWDIFCSVVDNYGDIGVGWRLARQLSSELGQSVRLWVDDLGSFQRMCHGADLAQEVQRVAGVEIRRWSAALPAVEPADIVIEAFGVRLPDNYIEAMAARTPHPVWVNLEYLSAEDWVEGCHGLPSPHPRLSLTKHFFFPGFTPATGGVLMEKGLAQTRDAFQYDAEAVAHFWQSLGVAPFADNAVCVSLFCYDNDALAQLVAVWSSGAEPVICIVPAGKALQQLSVIAGRGIEPGARFISGQLTIEAVPFLELDQYDRLLWVCDVNFVRGEDSFVRAQLAARPLVWQAYPQQEDAHRAKVSAFLSRYVEGLDDATAAVVRSINDAWNREAREAGRCWEALVARRNAAALHARGWATKLAAGGSLAIKLAEFVQDRLE